MRASTSATPSRSITAAARRSRLHSTGERAVPPGVDVRSTVHRLRVPPGVSVPHSAGSRGLPLPAFSINFLLTQTMRRSFNFREEISETPDRGAFFFVPGGRGRGGFFPTLSFEPPVVPGRAGALGRPENTAVAVII